MQEIIAREIHHMSGLVANYQASDPHQTEAMRQASRWTARGIAAVLIDLIQAARDDRQITEEQRKYYNGKVRALYAQL